MSAPKHVEGDKVLVNGNLVATIQLWDEVNNRLVFVTQPSGGGTDTVYGHISQYRIEAFPPVSDVPVAEESAPAEAAGDEGDPE